MHFVWHHWLFQDNSGQFLAMFVEKDDGAFKETWGHFPLCLRWPKPNIFHGKLGHLQLCSWRPKLDIFMGSLAILAVSVLAKLGVFREISGHFQPYMRRPKPGSLKRKLATSNHICGVKNGIFLRPSWHFMPYNFHGNLATLIHVCACVRRPWDIVSCVLCWPKRDIFHGKVGPCPAIFVATITGIFSQLWCFSNPNPKPNGSMSTELWQERK